MTRLASRLTSVEARLRPRSRTQGPTTVFLYDELEPCMTHPRCDLEIATGLHLAGVIHLSFDSERSPLPGAAARPTVPAMS